jgi:hypothetical protein
MRVCHLYFCCLHHSLCFIYVYIHQAVTTAATQPHQPEAERNATMAATQPQQPRTKMAKKVMMRAALTNVQ